VLIEYSGDWIFAAVPSGRRTGNLRIDRVGHIFLPEWRMTYWMGEAMENIDNLVAEFFPAITLFGGLLIGWIIGNIRGRKQARPDLDWGTFVRENAGYDFGKVLEKAQQIVRLANEIGSSARRGEDMVKSLSARSL
jgi:hypothetical protein